MVIRFLTIFLLLTNFFVSNTSISAPITTNPITVTVKNKIIEYGKPLKMVLTINALIVTDIDVLLKPFKESIFYEIKSESNNNNFITYKITIQTPNTGSFVIPNLVWKQYKTPAIIIDVIDPISNDNENINIKLSKVIRTPWVRQETSILVTVISSDKNIILQRKNIKLKGAESYLIPHSTIEKIHNGNVIYKHTIGWNIFFLYARKSNLRLPEIEYISDGVPKFKFHLNKIDFNIKKLPVYISPAIPVGKIKLESKLLLSPFLFNTPNKTAIVQYSLSGVGIPAKWLPSISQLYNFNNQKDITYSHIKTELKSIIENDSVLGNKTVDIAFTSFRSGFIPFEDINIQYFDPELGLLKNLKYIHKKYLVLNWFLQTLLVIIIFIMTIKFISWLRTLIRNKTMSYIHRSHCKKQLLRASNPIEIKLALNDFSTSENWPLNISLNQWLHLFKSRYVITDELITTFNTLNYLLYAQDKNVETDYRILKFSILNVLKNLKKSPAATK